MLSKAKIDYLISNGQYCLIYLEAAAAALQDHPTDRNQVLNHALSVSSLMNELRIATNECSRLSKLLIEKEAEVRKLQEDLRDIERGSVDGIVDERISMLKETIISFIQDCEPFDSYEIC